MKRPAWFIALNFAAAVLLAACGDSSAPDCPDGGKKNLKGECVNVDASGLAGLPSSRTNNGNGGTGATSGGDTGADGDTSGGNTETDEFGLVWVSIQGGSFEMGCVTQDTECDDNERPRHTVVLPGFQMTKTEITQAQYQALTEDNPSYHQPPTFAECLDCPVEAVTWNESKAFCEAAGGRLPSEAEWEYAARAGTATIYPCGDNAACLTDIAWQDVKPVKGKRPNAFGLYDMEGNAYEWNADCWHSNYYGAPDDGSAWADAPCSSRVWRGQGTGSGGRSSFRFSYDSTIRYVCLGFRCVKDLNSP